MQGCIQAHFYVNMYVCEYACTSMKLYVYMHECVHICMNADIQICCMHGDVSM